MKIINYKLKIENCQKTSFQYITFILLFFGSLLIVLPTDLVAQKIKGMSLNGPKAPSFEATMFEAIKVSNANWVAFIPEATLDRTTLNLKPDKANNWWGETIAANIEGIQLAKAAGFKVFLKPHIILGKIPKRKAKAIPVGNFTKMTPPKDKTRGVESVSYTHLTLPTKA